MAALTQDRRTPEREGRLVSDPLADGVTLYAGGMYVLDGDGNATPATADAANPVRAVALARASQPDGDQRVEGALGVFRFDNDGNAITRADIGGDAFVVDDQTVAKTGTAKAGVVVDVDEAGVWVRIGA